MPIKEVAQFDKTLTVARSVTTRIYDRASGGAEQCQFGAQSCGTPISSTGCRQSSAMTSSPGNDCVW